MPIEEFRAKIRVFLHLFLFQILAFGQFCDIFEKVRDAERAQSLNFERISRSRSKVMAKLRFKKCELRKAVGDRKSDLPLYLSF